MTKRIGKREAWIIAKQNAAALIETMDLDQLFGEVLDGIDTQNDLENILTEAQDKICKRIRSL